MTWNTAITSENLDDFKEDCELLDDWITTERVSNGIAGDIYLARKGSDVMSNYILKIKNENFEFYNEVQAYYNLRNLSIIPTVLAVFVCKKKGYIAMEKLYKCDFSAAKFRRKATHDVGGNNYWKL